jgi:hypothetical protein
VDINHDSFACTDHMQEANIYLLLEALL